MNQITLNIDGTYFDSKPAGVQIAGIRNRLAAGTVTIDPAQLADHIEKGGSFTPAAMTGTDSNSWQSQQVIIADVDNDKTQTDENGNPVKDSSGHAIKVPIDTPLTGQQAAAACKAAGITPYMMYHTFSNSDTLEKYRIVIILDEPITDVTEATELTGRLAALLNKAAPGCADTTMADPARLVFGGRPGSAFNVSRETTPLQILRQLPATQPEPAPRKLQQPASVTGQRRSLEELYAMRRRDIESFDLQGYIERTEQVRIRRSGKSVFVNPCPICGHNDDFSITGYLWHCLSASSAGNPGGTIIDYLMYRHQLTQGEALEKFNQIMGYDVIEWNRASKRTASRQSDFSAVYDKLPIGTTNDPQNGNEGPAGLLTLDHAIKVFEAASDKYLEMQKFPELCRRAKIKPHDSIVIAADTGAGKSSLAINFIDNLNDEYPCLYFNLEMDELTILRRLVSIRTGIELDRIEGYNHDGQTAAAVNAALKRIVDRKPLQIIQDQYYLTDIEQEIQRATAGREEPTIVIIDHSLLVKTREAFSRYERFTQISEELRRISRMNNVIMFLLLQQNRSGKEGDKRPNNSSLKESGSWENDATHILFLWDNPTGGKQLLMTKNRGGAHGDFNLEYYSATQFYQEAKEQPADTARRRVTGAGGTKRDRERQQLQEWYEAAYIKTFGDVTLYDIAEAGGVSAAVVKRRLKEYGGYTIDGVQYDAAGMDSTVAEAEFIRLTPGETPSFDDDQIKMI